MKKSSHAKERAKKLMSGRGGHSSETMKKSTGHKNALSGAMPKTFPVAGASPRKRSDKKPRKFAAGGGVDGDEAPKKKLNPKTEVNINIIGGGDKPPMPALPPGAGMPPPAGAPMMPPPRPMPPGAGMPPPGAAMPPPRPPGMMKRGGGVKENPEYPIDGGAGGGEGRLEKAAAQSRSRKGKHAEND